LLLVSVLASGCGAVQPGVFDSEGFAHGTYPYRVARGPDHRILPEQWRIENFQTDPHNADAVIGPKRGDAYTTTYELDLNDDGEIDRTSIEPRYDLRYIHAHTGAVLSVRTFPIDGRLRDVDLRVMARWYADSIAGAGIVGAQVGTTTILGVEHRYATRLSMERRARVHGQKAFLATIDVADVDQVQVWAESRVERLRIAIVRAPFPYETHRPGASIPLVMVVALVAQPDSFDDHLPAFDRLLGELVFTRSHSDARPGVELLDVPTTAVPVQTVSTEPSEPPPPSPPPALLPAPSSSPPPAEL